jgi:hypothetical protein
MHLKIFRIFFDWSEVWALFIPLAILLRCKPESKWLRPVKWYVLITLILNLCVDSIWYVNKFEMFNSRKGHMWNNNIFYNLNSIVRLLFFAWFFNLLNQRFMHRIKAIIPYLFVAFVVVNFSIYENFFPFGGNELFSSRLLATESALLLFYCLQYYIYLIIEEKTTSIQKQPGFWIVTGLTFYVAASFFIFLFYDYLTDANSTFAVDIWDVHNIVFIVLCTGIAIQYRQECKIDKK